MCTAASPRAEPALRTDPDTDDQLSGLVARTGLPITDTALAARALCHRSWCAEHPGAESNERLEFLGDAVLGLVIADHLHQRFPERDEGWLSQARSSLVRSSTLAELAAGLGLGDALWLGKGEEATGGREKDSILADVLEAVTGAAYRDQGWGPTRAWVLDLFAERIDDLPDAGGDHKSALQELLASTSDQTPDYAIEATGPEHDKSFFARVSAGGREIGAGRGRSKKEAEQQAAAEALRAGGDRRRPHREGI